MSAKKILIFYDHFYPAYRAGGPVQSLVNFVRAMYQEYDCHVVCRSHEAGSQDTLPGIIPNRWNNWEQKAKVYYWGPEQHSLQHLEQLLAQVQPHVVFINGIYSVFYNILPLYASLKYRKTHPQCVVVVSARGMLLKGALAQKALKKKIFLLAFRLLRWPAKIQWHATDSQEAASIKEQFGNRVRVGVAENFPNILPNIPGPSKHAGSLVLGTIALVGPMKNHLKVLEALQQSRHQITWHIYGPLLNPAYWQTCEAVLRRLPANISVHYHGAIPPPQVPEVMRNFQVFIMPSQSENFGHALFEALSAGKPVITTDTTPFKNLQEHKAGFTIPLSNIDIALANTIGTFAEMDAAAFDQYVSGAVQYAQSRFDRNVVRHQYKQLFQL